ncbi:uncharacterized protein [Enoplosus armatus]|uniref:uncharacterized protein n=1 Tax=Enoplosus armatus TaxID=215367 RepID=UPI0039918DFA
MIKPFSAYVLRNTMMWEHGQDKHNTTTAAARPDCIPVECLRCNITGESQEDPCALCSNQTACIKDIPPKCKRDFQVLINSTGSEANEGDDITLTCVHNLPNLNLTFRWKKVPEEILRGQNKSKLVLKRVSLRDKGQYICYVDSSCDNYKSLPHEVTVKDNNVVLLVICGVSALVLVLSMGLAMKVKLTRDNAKHKERMRQRAQAGQKGNPPPHGQPPHLTPRES